MEPLRLTKEMLASAAEKIVTTVLRDIADVSKVTVVDRHDEADGFGPGYSVRFRVRCGFSVFKMAEVLRAFESENGARDCWVTTNRDDADFIDFRMDGVSADRILPFVEWA